MVPFATEAEERGGSMSIVGPGSGRCCLVSILSIVLVNGRAMPMPNADADAADGRRAGGSGARGQDHGQSDAQCYS